LHQPAVVRAVERGSVTTVSEAHHHDADGFIAKWQGVPASELSTSQSFLIELCELLGVPRPHPAPEQDSMFERPVTFVHGDGGTSAGRIDLYRRGAFVLESNKLRQGAGRSEERRVGTGGRP